MRLGNTSTIVYINKTDRLKFPLKVWEKKICEFLLLIYHRRKILKLIWFLRLLMLIEPTEWGLNDETFRTIYKKFITIFLYIRFSIDFFVSYINKKCSRFCSRFAKLAGIAVDAFTISWKKKYFYVFPFLIAKKYCKKYFWIKQDWL